MNKDYEDLEIETSLLAEETSPYRYHQPQSKRHIPLAFSALAQRLQLQLRHRLGVTLSLRWTPKRPFPFTQPSICLPPRISLKFLLRQAIHALFFIPFLLLAVILLYGGVPPSYSDVKEKERALPQHHWNHTGARILGGTRGARSMQATGEGGHEESHPMYLRFPDHVWGHGLNNVLQEAILAAHLTLATSSRTPVFEPYTWSRLPIPYTLYDFTLRPTRVPLSAFVGGVLAGTVGANDNDNAENATRRAISAEYFEYVCPPSEIVEVVYGLPGVSADDASAREATLDNNIKPTYVYPHPAPPWYADGREILDWFELRLQAPDVQGKQCVVIREDGETIPGARRVFDTDFFGRDRILSILPDLLASPVLKQFEWSSLVANAVDRSIQSAFKATGQIPVVGHTLGGVLAVHLRRGDYGRHCIRLAEWSAEYLGVNKVLDDKLAFVDEGEDPAGVDLDEAGLAERKAKRQENYYLQHCLPSVEQIVQRLREVRAEYDGPSLKNVYVLTNGWAAFVDDLRDALLADGWDGVVATGDLNSGVRWYLGEAGLTREEKGVDVAIDMGIAERAEVFVGNGFSSLSANIVMLRMARGINGSGANRLL